MTDSPKDSPVSGDEIILKSLNGGQLHAATVRVEIRKMRALERIADALERMVSISEVQVGAVPPGEIE